MSRISLGITSILIFSGILLIANFSLNENLVFAQIVKLPDSIAGEADDRDKPAIPTWVDQNFRWYGEGLVTQTELINSLKHLIENNIIELEPQRSDVSDSLRQEITNLNRDTISNPNSGEPIPFTCDGVACDCNDRADCWDLMLSDSCSGELVCDGNENCSCWQASKGYDNSKYFEVYSFSFGSTNVGESTPYTCDGVACDCNGQDDCWDLMLSDSCSGDLSCNEDGNCSCWQESSIAIKKDQVNSDGDVDGLDYLIWQSHFGESVINDGQLITNQKVQQLVSEGIVTSETWQNKMSNAKQEINSAHTRNYDYPGLYSNKGIVDDLQVIVLFNNSLDIQSKLVQLEINHLMELTDRVERVTDEDMKRLDLLKQKLGSIQEGTAQMKFKMQKLMVTSVQLGESTSDFELKAIDVSSMNRELQELSDLMSSKQASTKITSNYQR